MKVVNIAAYKFVTLKEAVLPEWRVELKEKALQCDLKGTVLLSTEGINVVLAGSRDGIDTYQKFLAEYPAFQGLFYKESFSDYRPFTRMLVRLKKEIISMGRSEIEPEQKTAPQLSPEVFKQWYEEKRDMVVLDTRNDYEFEMGTFENVVDLNLETFRAFPDALDLLPESMKEKPVVTFCTGGVRCEKAAQLMLTKGFKEVYQLDGGILNYFEQCGGDFYEGECFVFDQRVALDAQQHETQTTQCYACRSPLTVQQQTSEQCPHCRKPREGRRAVAA